MMIRWTILASVFAVGLAGCAHKEAGTAEAGATAAAAPQPGNNVCIQTYLIDHTEVLDDNTILFYMRGREVWKNSLPYRCFGLKSSGGFQYETSINQICSNLQTIRVIEQGGGPRLGATCMLGAFTPYTPPSKQLRPTISRCDMSNQRATRSLCAASALSAVFILATGCTSPAATETKVASAHDCLHLPSVERTKIVDDNKILFFMSNKVVWKNSMQKCPTLKYEDAFAYETNYPEVCARTVISVLRSNVKCSLGEFSPAPPEPQKAAMAE